MSRLSLLLLVLAALVVLASSTSVLRGHARHTGKTLHRGHHQAYGRVRGQLHKIGKALLEKVVVPVDAEEARALLAVSSVPVPFTHCGNPSGDLVQILSLTSTVWPPLLGSTATLAAQANILQQINGGNTLITVSFDGIVLVNTTAAIATMTTLPVLKGQNSFHAPRMRIECAQLSLHSVDACSSAHFFNLFLVFCALLKKKHAGPLTLARNITVPASLPLSGAIGLQVAASNENSQSLFCILLNFNI